MRRSDIFLAATALNIAAVAALFAYAAYGRGAAVKDLELKRRLVREYQLTDLALFTEARYTRHPSMADPNTPFQDYPMSFEHFPSGSLVPVPAALVMSGSERLSAEEGVNTKNGVAR